MGFEITSQAMNKEDWAWAAIVEIALMHGWRPRGVPPGEIDFLNGFDDWDCPFIFNGGRNMPSNELPALGEAIHRAIEAHSKQPTGQAPASLCDCGEPIEYALVSSYREFLAHFAEFCMGTGSNISRSTKANEGPGSDCSGPGPLNEEEVQRDDA